MALTPAQIKRYAPLLHTVFFFRGLNEAELQPLLRFEGLGIQHYHTGEEIFSPTQASPMLGILLRGSAIVEKLSGKNPMRMSQLAPGSLFGLASIFLDQAQRVYPTKITASKDCYALLIPEDSLRKMMQADFRLTENYLRYLTGRIYFLNERIDGLIMPTVAERMLLYLQSNAQNNCLRHGLTQLAQALSISRATLYRALATLEEQGLIRRDGRLITLLPPGGGVSNA